MKKEKPEEPPKVEAESARSQEELAPPPTPEPDVDPNEELELSAGEEEAQEEKNGETVRLVGWRDRPRRCTTVTSRQETLP